MAADAEICALLSDTLETVGIARGDYVVRINNRKVLDGVLENVFSASEDGASQVQAEQKLAILRTIDKFDKVGEQGVRDLLGKGRQDDSGAFIDGVGLNDAQANPVIEFLTSKGANNPETLDNLRASVGQSAVGLDGVSELQHCN